MTTAEGPDSSTRREGAGDPTALPDVARTVAVLALVGAAVIHFAFAPDHLRDQTSHGVFFLVAGWFQLTAAAALALRWPPVRTWQLGTAAANLGVAALWLLTRTAGLPGDEAEAVGFPDTLATVLEVVAASLLLALALGRVPARSLRPSSLAVAGLPAVAMVALVTASVVPSLGGSHDHGDEEADGAHGHATGDQALDGHATDGHEAAGHDGDTASGDWPAQRLAALTGYMPDDQVEAFRQMNIDYLSEQIRTRSRALGDLPEAEREERIAEFAAWSVDHALEAEEPSGDEPTMHVHGPAAWQPITDPAEQVELQQQLQTAGTVIPEFLTAADAVATGYFQVTPYVPGIGAHYLNVDLLTRDGFDPAQPEMLLYNGNEPTSELIGLSYAVLGDEAPEGFVGPNDEWHEHPSLCIVGGLVVGPDSTPDELCESIGGEKGMPWDASMWMGHLWQVPGWESPWGLFSGENPTINMATSEAQP